MTAIVRARGLGKRFGRRWALADCTIELPRGRVIGVVGPNGAGKSTLLDLAGGMSAPSTGTIEVCGERPGASAEQRSRVAFVAQNAPTYGSLSVDDHLRLGARLNDRWDDALARQRISRLGLVPGQRAGQLSGGQRAQLALTVAIARRPELLILDEPAASLDPLARRELLEDLMGVVAEQEISVLLSSHLINDLERLCDYLVLLVDGRVQLAEDVERLLAMHHRLSGPRGSMLPAGHETIAASETDRQTTVVTRGAELVLDPAWTVTSLGLEDVVLAYLRRRSSAEPLTDSRPVLELVS